LGVKDAEPEISEVESWRIFIDPAAFFKSGLEQA
jgi:hypothetical protein